MILSPQQWHLRYKQQAQWTKNLRDHIFHQVGIQFARRVLDLGCGTGALLEEINHLTKASVFGLDISFTFARLAYGLSPTSSIVVGDAFKLPYHAEMFDVSMCHFVLLWLHDPISALREMVRVTRPNGYVLALAEPDYGGRIDYPDSLSKIGAWQIESLQEQGANPYIGRELRFLFSAADLDNIEVGVLGGQWKGAEQNEDFDQEWKVIQSDLHDKPKFEANSSELKDIDRSARNSQQRILYVPTFYAIGQVKA